MVAKATGTAPAPHPGLGIDVTRRHLRLGCASMVRFLKRSYWQERAGVQWGGSSPGRRGRAQPRHPPHAGARGLPRSGPGRQEAGAAPGTLAALISQASPGPGLPSENPMHASLCSALGMLLCACPPSSPSKVSHSPPRPAPHTHLEDEHRGQHGGLGKPSQPAPSVSGSGSSKWSVLS